MNIEKLRELLTKEVYIGDGVYVHFDGAHFVLKTQRDDVAHWIGLERDVLNSLSDYVLFVNKTIREHGNESN